MKTNENQMTTPTPPRPTPETNHMVEHCAALKKDYTKYLVMRNKSHSLERERDEAREERDALRVALADLVKLYIANPETEYEFISCITPKNASSLSAKERKVCKVWSAWDAARKLLQP